MKTGALRAEWIALAVAGSAWLQIAPSAAAPAVATAPATAVRSVVAVEGKLSWYGSKFDGRKTASGERFNAAALTMAHKTLPFGTRVKVTNRANGKSVVVRVNDRGPAQRDRIGDVSQAAARRLGMLGAGTVDARLEVLGSAKR